jgi:hypothetical protein
MEGLPGVKTPEPGLVAGADRPTPGGGSIRVLRQESTDDSIPCIHCCVSEMCRPAYFDAVCTQRYERDSWGAPSIKPTKEPHGQERGHVVDAGRRFGERRQVVLIERDYRARRCQRMLRIEQGIHEYDLFIVLEGIYPGEEICMSLY